MTTKTCNKCKETKALAEFGKNKGTKDGLRYRCKTCHNAERLAYVTKNPETRKVTNSVSLKRHWANESRSERAGRKSACGANQRSPLSSADLYGGLTFKEACAMTEPFARERLRLEADTGVVHHIDHIIPLKAGGLHVASNLQVLTASENTAKGAKE